MLQDTAYQEICPHTSENEIGKEVKKRIEKKKNRKEKERG